MKGENRKTVVVAEKGEKYHELAPKKPKETNYEMKAKCGATKQRLIAEEKAEKQGYSKCSKCKQI